MGRAPELIPILQASLSTSNLTYRPDTSIAIVTISNNSDMHMQLRYTGAHSLLLGPDRMTIPAHGKFEVHVKPGKIVATLDLPFVVENALIAPGQNPSILLTSQR